MIPTRKHRTAKIRRKALRDTEMKMSDREKEERKAAFRRMSLSGKADHIFTYYKLQLVLILIAVIAAGSVISSAVTRKERLLYLGLVNVAVGETLQTALTEGYVTERGVSLKKNEVYAYYNLYISDEASGENHEYSYASRLKMLAAMNAKQVDVVLLNRESYDLFSHSGYLLDLSELLQSSDPDLLSRAEPLLTENEVILEDNAIDVKLGNADSYQADTISAANALEVSGTAFFQPAGFPEPVYLGVIANSPRLSETVEYIRYITEH